MSAPDGALAPHSLASRLPAPLGGRWRRCSSPTSCPSTAPTPRAAPPRTSRARAARCERKKREPRRDLPRELAAPHRASCARRQAAALRTLLLAGADASRRARDGTAPLHVARDDECRLLLGGATKELAQQRGKLLLALAAEGDAAGLRQLHAAARVPLDFADERGFTALHQAAAARHFAVTAFLLLSPEGERLVSRTTEEAGASAHWTAAELAPPGDVSDLLREVAVGGATRESALELARRRVELKK